MRAVPASAKRPPPRSIISSATKRRGKPQRCTSTVDLTDQFGTATVFVGKPEFFCNPVDKNGEGIRNPAAHLTCYKIKAKSAKRDVLIGNEFGGQTLDLKDPELLCVPSDKIEVGQ
jgi:hypothetical protein